MRDIKFRAWDTITNKMHNTIEELCFENGILIEVIFNKYWDGIGSCADEVVDWQNADQTILMQYTGLNDKNGVEIYDGDKVSFVKTYNNKRYVGEVKYIPEVAGYMLCAMNQESWYSFEFGLGTVELEVIGNIHEQESHT